MGDEVNMGGGRKDCEDCGGHYDPGIYIRCPHCAEIEPKEEPVLRVTVDLVSAITGKTTTLGVAEIANDGGRSRETGGERGAYTVRLSKWAPKLNQTWKTGRVEDFDRKGRGPWDLLYLALKACVHSRNRGT